MGLPVLGLTGGRPPLPDGGLGRSPGPPEGRRVGSAGGDGASADRPPRALGPGSAWRGRREVGASREGPGDGRRSTGGRDAGPRVSLGGAGAEGAAGPAAAGAATSGPSAVGAGPAAAGGGAAAAGRAGSPPGSDRGRDGVAREGRAPASSGAGAGARAPPLDRTGAARWGAGAARSGAGASSGATARRKPSRSALRRARSAWASSMLEEWLLTPIPRDSQRSSASLLVTPSSRASS